MANALRSLLKDPPEKPKDIKLRLRGVRDIVRELVQCAREGLVRSDNWQLVAESARLMSKGKTQARALAAVAADTSVPLWGRAAAATAAVSSGLLGFDSVDAAVLEMAIFAMLACGNDDLARKFVEPLVVHQPEEEAARSLLRVERWRALAGIPGEKFWRDVAHVTVHSPPLDHEIALRTWVTPCDGVSAFAIVAEIVPAGQHELVEVPHTVLSLSIREAEGLSDGFVLRFAGPDTLALIREDTLRTGGCEAPPAEVCGIVRRAMARARDATRTGRDAAEVFLALDGAEPLDAPLGKLSAAQVEALIARPETFDSWVFDEQDVGPGGDDDDEEAMLARLDRPEVRARVVAMARHMARWWRWKGDTGASGAFAALAREAETGLRHSLLARAMLGRSEPYLGSKQNSPVQPTPPQ